MAETLKAHFKLADLAGASPIANGADTLSLPTIWTPWVLSEARSRQVDVQGVELMEEHGWCLCPAEDLLARSQHDESATWLMQRAGCNGLVTTVVFSDVAGRFGAWWVERHQGEPENHCWRSILLEALVLSCRNFGGSAISRVHSLEGAQKLA